MLTTYIKYYMYLNIITYSTYFKMQTSCMNIEKYALEYPPRNIFTNIVFEDRYVMYMFQDLHLVYTSQDA